MRQPTFLAVAAAFLVYASFSLFAQDANTPPETKAPAPQAHMPMPKPTNLQVLPKDIAPPDLMKLMGGYSRALGVHCNFCHEVNEQTHQPNFAADTKPDKDHRPHHDRHDAGNQLKIHDADQRSGREAGGQDRNLRHLPSRQPNARPIRPQTGRASGWRDANAKTAVARIVFWWTGKKRRAPS